jgi:hypothetical protein
MSLPLMEKHGVALEIHEKCLRGSMLLTSVSQLDLSTAMQLLLLCDEHPDELSEFRLPSESEATTPSSSGVMTFVDANLQITTKL